MPTSAFAAGVCPAAGNAKPAANMAPTIDRHINASDMRFSLCYSSRLLTLSCDCYHQSAGGIQASTATFHYKINKRFCQ
jgi:hypothetical protein